MTIYPVLYVLKFVLIIYTLYYVSYQDWFDHSEPGVRFHLNPVFHKLGQ